MMAKDYSLSKKAGWKEYSSTSWILPFKFGGSAWISKRIYFTSFFLVASCIHYGGMEKSIKLLLGQISNK